MKWFWALLLFLNLSHANTNSVVRITSNHELEKLRQIPQSLMAALVEQGFKMQPLSSDTYELVVEDLTCHWKSRDAEFPDSIYGGLPTVKCFLEINTDHEEVKVLQEGRYILSLLKEIERELDVNYFTDCAMGQCWSVVRKISCTVDQRGPMNSAFACQFFTEQN